MGRASISIAITSNFNSNGIDAAIRKAEQLATSLVHYRGQYGKAAVDMGASMGMAAARLVSMGKAVADFGDKLTMGVTVPMGLAAAAAVTSAAKIDTAWYNVRKTVDMTEEGYENLKRSAMDLSEVQPVSAETILNIEALGGQLGITNGHLEDFARVVSGLDISTNMDFETSASSLAQFRNIVQMSEDDLDNWASTVVDLGNHTATTEADMVNLAMRFASAGHIAGMSNAEILGMSAALSGLGMKAEAGGSAISRTINDINNSVAVGGENLQKWADLVGKTPEQFAEAWRAAPMDEFIDVLTHINEAGSDMGAVLEDLGITQIRQSDAMRRLAGSGDYVRETVERANEAWKENSALTQEVERRNESLQARWDTFCNRMTNDLARIGQPLAEMGLGFLEGLEPAIQGVGDLAESFANASPDVQRFTFNLLAVTAAAGPVLSITGRLMQAFGKVGQAVGRGYQAWGRYQEGLHSTNMETITSLSASGDMAASFGLARNRIVKAAGGLDTFNVAYRRTISGIEDRNRKVVQAEFYEAAYAKAMQKTNMTEEKAAGIAERAARSSKAKAEWTKRIKKETDELNGSINEGNVALKLNTASVTDADRQMEKSARTYGKFGDAVKGALLGLGGMAVTGAAIAGITWIATQFQLASERAENLRLATEGLRNSLTKTTDAAEGQRRVWGTSIAAVDEAIEKQAQLGQTFEQNNTAAQSSIHSLDRAAEAIRSYANRSGLSATEQYRLKSAIDTVNEACGTQFSVVDASNGKIADETGTIQENTDAILDNVEARKKELQLQAIESNYQAAYENELTAKKALRDAQTEFNDALERYRELVAKNNEQGFLAGDEATELEQLRWQLGPLADAVKRESEAVDEATETTGYWEDQLDSAAGAADRARGSIEQLLASDTDFSVAFEGLDEAGRDLDAFAATTQALGINFDALEGLSSKSANAIAQAFDGTATSVVKAMEGIDEAQYILENIGNNWYNSFSTATQGIIGSVAATKDMTLAELSAMATDFGIRGEQAMQAFMAGLDSGMDASEAAKFAQQFDEAFGDSLDPEVAAKAARAFIDALNDNMNVEDAIAKAQEVIDGLKGTLSGASFEDAAKGKGTEFFAALGAELQQGALDASTVWSDTGKAVGKVLPDGTIQGIEEGSANIPNAVQGMVDGAKPPLDSLAPYAQQSGQQAGEGYGTGLSLGGQGAGSSADTMVQSLVARLLGGVGQATDAGSQTGQGYGDAVSGQGSVAETAAVNTLGRLLAIWLLGIASARQAGLRTGQAYGEGAQAGFTGASNAAMAAVYNTVAYLATGIGPAQAAGAQTGSGYGIALSTNLLAAATFAQAAVATIVASLNSGVAPAQQAGNATGTGYASALTKSASTAVAAAASIGRATGAAFGTGTGSASAAGTALGRAFASAVWSSGGQAVAYARSIRNSVKSIFDDIPTAKIKVKVQTVSAGAGGGGGGGAIAALPSSVPVMPVPFAASASRAAVVAERAVQRVSTTTTRVSSSRSPEVAVTALTGAQTAPIDYDAMYRVVRGGVRAAIRESGGLSPVVELDGRVVSRQLAPRMDYELGRLQGLRG